MTRAFEFTREKELKNLPDSRQRFTAMMIVNEVKKIAREKNMTEEEAYYWYSRGLYGADRVIDR